MKGFDSHNKRTKTAKQPENHVILLKVKYTPGYNKLNVNFKEFLIESFYYK